jgi:L-ascorbate metabolism protein UlaG (beta-lactamase superfamily)
MTNPGQTRLTFHKHTFFELSTQGRTLFVDPVFSHERRGRRVADEVRGADYVLATSATPWFEDILDVLEACEATFVATPRLCRTVGRELDLPKKRLLDLEPWERASEPGFRLTAFPIQCSLGMEGAIEEGASILQDLTNVFPRSKTRIPLVGNALPMLESTLQRTSRTLGGLAPVSQLRSLDRVNDMLGLDVSRIARGRPGLGYLFELEGHPSLLHLADGVHAGTSEDDLEEVADVCAPDVVVVQVEGMDVEPLVRAVRILGPKTVLLFRARDPYAAGRRGQTLPVGSFISAIEEGASDCEALHLKNGDTFILDRSSIGAATAARAGQVTVSPFSGGPAAKPAAPATPAGTVSAPKPTSTTAATPGAK